MKKMGKITTFSKLKWFLFLNIFQLAVFTLIVVYFGYEPSLFVMYFFGMYVNFLQIFPKIDFISFFRLGGIQTEFTKKYYLKIGITILVLMILYAVVNLVGWYFQIAGTLILSSYLAFGSIVIFYSISQVYYSKDLGIKNMGVNQRKSLVNSLIFYIPLQTWHWSTMLKLAIGDYVLFPFIKSEFQTVFLTIIIGIVLYVIFIEFPFWRGQKISKESRLEKAEKENISKRFSFDMIKKSNENKKLLEKMSLQLDLLMIENEIRNIKDEPLHPYKGLLSLVSILIGASAAPLIDLGLKFVMP